VLYLVAYQRGQKKKLQLISLVTQLLQLTIMLRGNSFKYNRQINPVEKWMEVVEENKKLYAALLKEKDEKIALLEKLLEKK
jgi:hypothetical protein